MTAASKNQSWKDLHKYFSHVIDGISTPIDAGIIDVVVGLNAVGVNTEASCEGHLDHGNTHPWIRIGAPGVDDLEEEFRQARLRVQRASESDHDQAFAEYSEIEQRLKSLHMQEWDKVVLLLEAFYKLHLVEYDRHLVVLDFLITGAFFLQSLGAVRQDTREPNEKAMKLKEYQEEMHAFAAFLKENFLREEVQASQMGVPFAL